MKNLKLAAISVCITFCSVYSIAQNIQNRSVSVNEPHYNKPKLFGDLGARLIFTKLTDPNNSVKYIGRIISLKHGDSYEIISENDQYYLKKKGIYELMTE